MFIIDDFNERYKGKTKEELKVIADQHYNEMDICVIIGYPFRHMAHYTVGDNKRKGSKVNHDIYVSVSAKEFKIGVKYLKNWKSSSGKSSASKNWIVYREDFDWLSNEIQEGNKGRRAFIIGWFNCMNNFSALIQLRDGKTAGSKPSNYTTDLIYNYNNAYKSLQVNLIGTTDMDYNCYSWAMSIALYRAEISDDVIRYISSKLVIDDLSKENICLKITEYQTQLAAEFCSNWEVDMILRSLVVLLRDCRSTLPYVEIQEIATKLQPFEDIKDVLECIDD